MKIKNIEMTVVFQIEVPENVNVDNLAINIPQQNCQIVEEVGWGTPSGMKEVLVKSAVIHSYENTLCEEVDFS